MQGLPEGFGIAHRGILQCFLVGSFKSLHDGAIAVDAAHEKRIGRAPVFGLDVVTFAANLEIGIMPSKHGGIFITTEAIEQENPSIVGASRRIAEASRFETCKN